VVVQLAIQYMVGAEPDKVKERLLQARRSRGADEVVRVRRRHARTSRRLDLDEAYADADTIAKHIQTRCRHRWPTYGYAIINALITNIEPDQRVRGRR